MKPYDIVRGLGPQIQGLVIDSGDEGYSESIELDNSRIKHEPLVVVRPDSSDDVALTIRFCQEHGLPLTIKSGGHSAAGYSLNSLGVVLDLVRMNVIEYSSENTLRVGAGTRWIEIYDFLHAMNDRRIVVGGGCPTVGVGGFLLGAGFSFLSRSLGLGSDNVTSLTIITADGRERTITRRSRKKDEKELFWALQGGGGGNFGVVTEFELELREVSDPLMVGQIVFPFYRVQEILEFYDHWVTKLPNEMAVYGMMRNFPDPRNDGKPIFSLRFTPIFNGDYASGIELLEPLLELHPITSEFHAMTLPEWENFIGSATKVRGSSAYIKSVVMQKKKLHQASRVFQYFMSRRPEQDSYIVWTHTGGAVSTGPDTCYPHRDAEVVVEVKSIWDSDTPSKMRANVEWAHRFFTALEPYSSGAYINYIDPLLPNWQKSYYGENYPRLCAVKRKWDPTGFFSFQQGVGSPYKPVKAFPNGSLDLSALQWTL